jgi:integrase
MPRQAKGPRLYLRTGRVHPRTGKPIPDVYFIRDGSVQISTGCGPERLHGPDGAEARLGAYIAEKWSPQAAVANSSGDPASILVAEVLAFYAQKKAPKLARPSDTASRVKILLEWWADKTLADVKMSTCEAYVEHRTGQGLRQAKRGAALEKRCTPQGARRELEDLSAAIGFYQKEHKLNWRPLVSLPQKGQGNREALTRSEAAALLWAAMGWRWVPEHVGDANEMVPAKWTRLSRRTRANRAHIRRFVLIGLYTGTRPGVLPKLLWEEAATQAWVDLDDGAIYRRGKREREHRNKRRPMVKLPPRLLAHMRRWKRLDDEASARAAEAAKKAGEPPPEPLTTVLHHGGSPIASKVRTGWESCVRDAGLPAEVSPHWLRHTAATWLMEAGVDMWDAAGYLGMTAQVLGDTYAHHRPDHQAKARKAIGGKR